MVNSCGLTNQSRLKTNNTTTSRNYGGDQNSALPQSVKICGFPNETYKMLSHDIRSWFGQLRKLDKSGKTIMIKYCGQEYGNTCLHNKISRNTKYNKYEDGDPSTSKDEDDDDSDSKYCQETPDKKVNLSLAGAKKTKQKHNLKKSCRLDTRRSFNKIQNEPVDCGYIHNSSDTFGIGGNAWIIESTT